MTLTFKVKFNLINSSHFDIIHAKSHHRLNLEPPNSDKKMQNTCQVPYCFLGWLTLKFRSNLTERVQNSQRPDLYTKYWTTMIALFTGTTLRSGLFYSMPPLHIFIYLDYFTAPIVYGLKPLFVLS